MKISHRFCRTAEMQKAKDIPIQALITYPNQLTAPQHRAGCPITNVSKPYMNAMYASCTRASPMHEDFRRVQKPISTTLPPNLQLKRPAIPCTVELGAINATSTAQHRRAKRPYEEMQRPKKCFQSHASNCEATALGKTFTPM